MAIRGPVDDPVGVLHLGEPGEWIARCWRRPCKARQIVLSNRAVRPPKEAADMAVGPAESNNVGRPNGIVIGPCIARRSDGVRLSGQIAMTHAALSLPPQFVEMPIGRAVDDVVNAVMSREPARWIARGLGRVDRAGQTF